MAYERRSQVGPWMSLQARASPTLGPRQSPALSPADRTEPSAPRRGAARAGLRAGARGAPGWASEVETATHAPVEVPLWLCPQLSFHTYPAGARPGDLNAALRSGQAVGGRRKLVMSRPPRLGEGYDVQYRGRGVACAGGGQERLSDALGAAVSQAAASPRGGGQPGSALGARSPLGEEPVEELRTAAAEVTMAPAWGAVGYLGVGSVEDAGGNLLQADGVGCGMEEVVEDWLTAP
ncbi:unnamed protein product [Prorocentrum cordatum]|uniref:DNA replication complex GINS protein PSF3 n=1 Tax=Prorocentrum cordatum TaxID=2364126 RepID=A0ABN9WGN9_9DINO|nr:unnamed protein product [Polarella glacialis]